MLSAVRATGSAGNRGDVDHAGRRARGISPAGPRRMKVQPAAFLRTTLPLDLGVLPELDSGRYHSIWLPDHMVSFWPDSIWTPEFTDLATVSPSPHRYVDAMAVAGAVVGPDRAHADRHQRHRHRASPPGDAGPDRAHAVAPVEGPVRSRRGSGEVENTVPYGLDFSRPASRFEEALEVITLLWEQRGAGRLPGAVLPPRARPPRHRALRGPGAPDLDRRQRARACSTSPVATPTAGGRPTSGRPTTTPTS